MKCLNLIANVQCRKEFMNWQNRHFVESVLMKFFFITLGFRVLLFKEQLCCQMMHNFKFGGICKCTTTANLSYKLDILSLGYICPTINLR